ncbi:hypothetical protein FOZ63_033236, partial [Perkinsus olseni]
GFGAFGSGQTSAGFGAFGGGGGSQPQKDGDKEEKAAPAKEESVQREKEADGKDQAIKKEGDRREDGKASAAHRRAGKKEGKEEESPSPVAVSSNTPSLGDARLVSRAPASEVTLPAEPERPSVEDSQKKTKALLEEIAKDADDGDDSREARALFSEVEKDLEQLEAFMAEARRSPCKAASQVDISNEVWTQLRKSVDSLTEVANEETLKQLDEIQRKNYALNAQLNEEMLSEDKQPSEVVVELRERCKDISGRIDEAYGECKKALFMRRGRRQSGGSRAPSSPEVPPAPRVPIRPRPSVIVDGPTMPSSLLAPPARRRQDQRKSGGGSALGRLAQASPQSSTVIRSRPTPPAIRIQPEENVDSLRATVRRMRNPLRRRTSTAAASNASSHSTTVGALLSSKPTEGKVVAPALALSDEKENDGAAPNIWSIMRTKANVSAEIQSLWEKVSEMERRLREVRLERGGARHLRQRPAIAAPMAALVDHQPAPAEDDKVANVRSELRHQLDSSRTGSIGRAPSSGSWSETSDFAAGGSVTGTYSTPSVTNVPAAAGGLMFVNPLGGSGTPTFGGGRASPAASNSRSPSRTSKESVKSINAAREAAIPKAVVPPAPKLETIPSVPPPPKLNASPPRTTKHRTLSSSMSFGPPKEAEKEKRPGTPPSKPDKAATEETKLQFGGPAAAAVPSTPVKMT